MIRRHAMRAGALDLTGLLFVAASAARAADEGDETLNRLKNDSVNTGSFVYHVYAPGEDFTQYFDNRLIAAERRVRNPIVDGVLPGSFVHSDGNRCLLLGVQKNWRRFNRRTTLERVYAYAGEFFFEAFSECGAEGDYHGFEKATGVGFAPYVYHGIEYDLTPSASLEAGSSCPGSSSSASSGTCDRARSGRRAIERRSVRLPAAATPTNVEKPSTPVESPARRRARVPSSRRFRRRHGPCW